MKLQPTPRNHGFYLRLVFGLSILLAGQFAVRGGNAGTINALNAISEVLKPIGEQQQQADAAAAADQQQQADAAQQQAQANAIAQQQKEMANRQALNNGTYANNNSPTLVAVENYIQNKIDEQTNIDVPLPGGGTDTVDCYARFAADHRTLSVFERSTRDNSAYAYANTACETFDIGDINPESIVCMFDTRKTVYNDGKFHLILKTIGGQKLIKFQLTQTGDKEVDPPEYIESIGFHVKDAGEGEDLKGAFIRAIGLLKAPLVQQLPPPSLPKGVYDFQDDKCGHVSIATCNYVQNFEGDNVLHSPDDYVGAKNYFSTKEKITISMIASIKQSGYGIKLWDGNGNLIIQGVLQNSGPGITYTSAPNTTNALASSSYTAAFYHDNTLIKKINFIVGN